MRRGREVRVLVVAAATAANAASFARYRRRHLRRIPNPIADFRTSPPPATPQEAAKVMAAGMAW